MSKEAAALDIKSANLYALRVLLRDADTDKLLETLDARMREAGSLFENEPIILDTSPLPDDATLDWPTLVHALRSHKLPPIGVVAHGGLQEAAAQAGLTPVELSAPTPRPASALPNAAPKAPQPPAAMIVSRPLRSGQRIYARDSDLVVIGMVSQGAEVIADGNIHVYGPLRGKAMAGARGNTAARIFTTHLDPELLSIAGIYHVLERKLAASLHGCPAQIWLEDKALKIAAM